MSGLHFIVARGKDAGSRLRIDAGDRVVGRARDADLVLLDPRVSRKHLRVRASGEGAEVTLCEGATPFLLGGEPRSEALLQIGDTIVVGDSALVLARDAESGLKDSHTTEVGALMTGLAADVRGLAAAMALVDALDAADDEGAIRVALRAWGKQHANALDADLLVGSAVDAELADVNARARHVVERPGPEPNTVLLLAPAHGSDPAWITFTCPVPTGGITDTLRRLVAVAGRLCASTLARVRSLRLAEDDRELFRRASLGSARSFLGDSAAAREVSKLVARLAASDVVVLLDGETGVGKTFLARLLHEAGDRAKAPLRIINCAAIPDTLIESELFGHERGAFTGATTSRAGALEAAGRGTLLLDEIGELPLASQAKLLRVLEEKRFERVGSNRAITLEARIIAATNRDLAAMVEKGTFRQDLFFRIAVVKLRVPPLRERGDDLPLLAARILADLAPSAGRRVDGFSPAAIDAIRRYPWPGNVRELRNAIERALVVGEGARIEPEDLPETVIGAAPLQPTDESLVRLPAKLEWLEERAIQAALRATGGNQRRAALLLGINRVTLHRKLRTPSDEE
jgi:two-component system response regulator HydG